MCLAGAMGEKADPTSDAQKRFRSLLFQLAVSFLHELSHMFLTFLGRGKVGTPPHMSVAVDGSSEAPGPEAGRYLETSLFGGFLNVFRDTAEDDDQVCSYLPTLADGLAWELIRPLGRLMLPFQEGGPLPNFAGDD